MFGVWEWERGGKQEIFKQSEWARAWSRRGRLGSNPWRSASLPCAFHLPSLKSVGINVDRRPSKLRMTWKVSHWLLKPAQSHMPVTGLPHFTFVYVSSTQARGPYRMELPLLTNHNTIILTIEKLYSSQWQTCCCHQLSILKSLCLPSRSSTRLNSCRAGIKHHPY